MIDRRRGGSSNSVSRIFVAEIADDKCRLVRHGPAEAGRQIVEHDDFSPASMSSSAMWLPIYPAPPVTRIAMVDLLKFGLAII